LKFITKYLESVEDRIEIYEQIRDSEDNLVAQVKSSKTMLANEGHNFSYLTEEQKEVCTRDIKTVIRCSAAAILLDEPDRLKEALLLWYFTIARAIGFIDHCQIAYQILEKTIQQKVTPEQAKLAAPILRLNYTILSP
jgi:Phycobilisome protein